MTENFGLMICRNRTYSSPYGIPKKYVKPKVYENTDINTLLRSKGEKLDFICNYLLLKSRAKVKDALLLHEWRLLAIKIDKVLLVLFLVANVISMFIMLIYIPIKYRGF